MRSAIPVARGLGSSGAAIAAGLLLGNALRATPRTLDELCALGTTLEGHPDNVCAALVGGCTMSVPLADGRVRVVRQALHETLGFALAWPDAQLSTHAARAVLPREVSFADAVENPRRLALLLEGLRSGDAQLLTLGGEDRLHVRHRLPLIRGGEEALRAARAAGAALATISGSGSSLIAIGAPASCATIAEAMRVELARHGGAHAYVARTVLGTPEVKRSASADAR